MADPFSKATDRRMVREAQIGLAMITGLLALFVYLTYNRITGNGIEIPESVRRSRPQVARLKSPEANRPRLPLADVPRLDKPAHQSNPPADVVTEIDDEVADSQAIQLTNAELPATDPALPKIGLPRPLETPDWGSPRNPAPEPLVAVEPRTPENANENAFQPIGAMPSPELPKVNHAPKVGPKPLGNPVDDPFANLMAAGKEKRTGGGGFELGVSETQTARSSPTLRQPIRLPKQGNLHPDQPVLMERPPATIATLISQPGDSWFLIAQRTYGDGAWMSALAEFNRQHGRATDSVQPGSLILTPTKDQLQRDFPGLCPTKRAGQPGGPVESLYITKAGETLFGIARDELGQASRYLEIQELNRTVLDPEVTHLTRLPAGLRLVLPEVTRTSDH